MIINVNKLKNQYNQNKYKTKSQAGISILNNTKAIKIKCCKSAHFMYRQKHGVLKSQRDLI